MLRCSAPATRGRYEWDGTLRIGQLIAATAWDCLPGHGAVTPAGTAAQVTVCAESAAVCGIPK